MDRLRSGTWYCASCGIAHQGIFDLAAFAPAFWDGPIDPEPNSALRLDDDFLSEDFCVLGGEHFFVRGVLEIPVHGMSEKFGFGVWSTLSRQNFEVYVDRFDEGDYAGLGPWTGWFSSELPTFADTVKQGCRVYPQLDRQRPVVSLGDPNHPLSIAQSEGITAQELFEIYEAAGHGAQ